MPKSIFSYSSKPEYYTILHRYAAILENKGYVALVPIDIKGILPNAMICDDLLTARTNLSLRDIRDKRIKLSDTLVVYIRSEDEEPIDFNTLMDIVCAVENNIEIYVACDGDISVVIDFIKKEFLHCVTIEIKGVWNIEWNIGLNGGYYIHLTNLKIALIER